MSTLRFRRPMFYPDRLRSYQLIVDGIPMGVISAGSTVEISAAAGRHEIVARIDWCSSNTVQVEVKEGATCELEVGSNLGGWRIFLVMVYITFFQPVAPAIFIVLVAIDAAGEVGVAHFGIVAFLTVGG